MLEIEGGRSRVDSLAASEDGVTGERVVAGMAPAEKVVVDIAIAEKPVAETTVAELSAADQGGVIGALIGEVDA